jgi:hypothetical protein
VSLWRVATACARRAVRRWFEAIEGVFARVGGVQRDENLDGMTARMKPIDLSDEDLVARLSAICGDARRLVAGMIVHLIEVEERRLHLKAACSSMFEFCLRRLGIVGSRRAPSCARSSNARPR